MYKPLLASVLLAGAAGLSGCVFTAADPSPPSLAEAAEAQEPETETVARVQLTETHSVEIVEHPAGLVGVLELRHADLDGPGMAEGDMMAAAHYSFVELYDRLAATPDLFQPPEVDRARLQAIDEGYALFRSHIADDEAAEHLDEHRHDEEVPKSHVQSWANYDIGTADFNWFSGRFCTLGHTDNCETGLVGRLNAVHVSHSFAFHVFNQHSSQNALYLAEFDPCYGVSGFCSKPFKILKNEQVAPRFVRSHSWFGNQGPDQRFRYSATIDGPHWGWSINFFNP